MSDERDENDTTDAIELVESSETDAANGDLEEADEESRVGPRARRLLLLGALAVCALVALWALVGAYQSVHAVVYTWIADEYQPFFTAAVDILVLCLAGLVASRILDRVDALD